MHVREICAALRKTRRRDSLDVNTLLANENGSP